jgi:hypothetical protein
MLTLSQGGARQFDEAAHEGGSFGRLRERRRRARGRLPNIV